MTGVQTCALPICAIVIVKDNVWVCDARELLARCRSDRGDSACKASSKDECQGPREGMIRAERNRHTGGNEKEEEKERRRNYVTSGRFAGVG